MDEKALEMMKTSGKFLDEELIAKKAAHKNAMSSKSVKNYRVR